MEKPIIKDAFNLWNIIFPFIGYALGFFSSLYVERYREGRKKTRSIENVNQEILLNIKFIKSVMDPMEKYLADKKTVFIPTYRNYERTCTDAAYYGGYLFDVLDFEEIRKIRSLYYFYSLETDNQLHQLVEDVVSSNKSREILVESIRGQLEENKTNLKALEDISIRIKKGKKIKKWKKISKE